MSKAPWALALLVALPALAQAVPDGGTATTPTQSPPVAEAVTPDAGTLSPSAATQADLAQLSSQVSAELAKAKKQIEEHVRAQLATQTASQISNEGFPVSKRKLELFVPNGYLRVRPELLHKFGLGWGQPDPSGYFLFPRTREANSIAGVNMRFRFEPTINVSESVRIRAQIDALDNLVFGSTPDYAYSRSDIYSAYGILNEGQAAPRSGINATFDSIEARRVWGEVSTPVGILRFGRMGSQWGLGMLHNDGNCLDCDFGDTVDRIMFVAPVYGFYVVPAIDFNVEGPIYGRDNDEGHPFDLNNSDDAHSLVLVVAKRDTAQEIRDKLAAGRKVFEYGLHFEYRTQKVETLIDGSSTGGDVGDTQRNDSAGSQFQTVLRDAILFEPDIWLHFETPHLKLALEVAAKLGNFKVPDLANPTTSDLISVVQFGGVFRGEYRLVHNRLHIGLEVGFASGDRAPGLGNHPSRVSATSSSKNIGTEPGDIDGPQFACQATGGCNDSSIRNFRFNRDFQVDEILFRQILGGITDAVYIKPSLSYSVADGLDAFVHFVYSRSIYASSTPSTVGHALGLEIDVGARYSTDDGFFAGVTYGVLFPFSGLQPYAATAAGTSISLDKAQTVRGVLGIKF